MKLCSTVEAYIAGDTPAKQPETGQQCGSKWIYWKYPPTDEKKEITHRDFKTRPRLNCKLCEIHVAAKEICIHAGFVHGQSKIISQFCASLFYY